MKKKVRAVVIAVCVMAVLPSLLGVQPVVRALLGLVGPPLPGALTVESCSIGWLHGMRCELVRYHDPVRGLLFTSPRLTSDKGLLSLAVAPLYLGEIVLDHPSLTFLPPQSGHESTQSQEQDSSGATSAPPSARMPNTGRPWWERVTLRLQANGGELLLDEHPAPARQLARDISLDGNLAMGTINYEVELHAAQQGMLRAKGFVNLPTVGQSVLETLISRSDVVVSELDIAGLLDLAASRSKVPHGKGVLDAALHFNAAGLADLEASGQATLRDVQLTGGVLGDEHPMLDRLHFIFKGSHHSGEGWRLSALDLQSAPVMLKASGSYNNTTVALTASGSVALPVLAAQVPRLLGLHEKTTITEGGVDFSLDVEGEPESMAVRARCKTDRLSVDHAGRRYVWNTPLDLLAEANHDRGRIAIRTLRVKMPFFEARSSGGIDDFTLEAKGDLDRMSQELGTIFAIDLQARGQAKCTAQTRRGQDGGFTLESRVAIDDFALARGKATLMPSQALHLSADVAATPSFLRDGALHSLSIAGDFWPGKVRLRAKDMQRNVQQEESNCDLQGNLDLERLSNLAQGFSGGGQSSIVKGNLTLAASGECEGRRMALHSLNGSIDRFAAIGAGYTVQEPRVVFGMGPATRLDRRPVAVRELLVATDWQDMGEQERPLFQADFSRQSLEIRHLGWASARANLDADVVLEDWRRSAAGYSVILRGETDGPLLTELVRATGWLPGDMVVKGRAKGQLTAFVEPHQEQRTDLSLRVTPFELWRGKEKLFTDPQPALALSWKGESQGAGVKIPSLSLQTAPLRIEGTGLMTKNSPPILELQGQVTPDFAALSPSLAPVLGKETVAVASRPGDFLLSLPLAFPLRKEQLTFTAQVPLDSLRAGGVTLRQCMVPVDVNRGRLRIAIDEKFDNGRIAFNPEWDFAAPQAVMSLPEGSQLLKDVSLKPQLEEGLLGRMHPLFGVLALAQGTVDLRLDGFSAPLVEKKPYRPTFTATIALDRVKFKARDALRELLDLAGIAPQWLRCRERELTCEGKNGEVRCNPVHLVAGEQTIELTGQLGMDDALRYQARMPLAKKLAEKAQLIVQADSTVVAEIGGTRLAPAFDQTAFLAGLPEQIRKGITLNDHKPEGQAGSSPAPPQPAAEAQSEQKPEQKSAQHPEQTPEQKSEP